MDLDPATPATTRGRLRDRGALVTGGASGIGEATARRFAAEGADVVIADINDQAAKAVAADIRAAHGSAHVLHADVTDRAAVRRMVHEAQDLTGSIDVLVNAAIINPSVHYGEDERWDLVSESGLAALWAAGVEAGKVMGAGSPAGRGQGGSIVNIASIAGARLGSDFGSEAYHAIKAGVVGLTRVQAKRLGPAGVRVNCICPGLIDTPRWHPPGTDEPEEIRRLRSVAPLGRYGRPEEIAAVALFLGCDQSSFITGQDIAVDGGFSTAPCVEAVGIDNGPGAGGGS